MYQSGGNLPVGPQYSGTLRLVEEILVSQVQCLCDYKGIRQYR
jgi:hypothetical protein